jgi:hypothetical protein
MPATAKVLMVSRPLRHEGWCISTKRAPQEAGGSFQPLALTGKDPDLLTKTDPPWRGDGSVEMSINLEHAALAGLGLWDLRSD